MRDIVLAFVRIQFEVITYFDVVIGLNLLSPKISVLKYYLVLDLLDPRCRQF